MREKQAIQFLSLLFHMTSDQLSAWMKVSDSLRSRRDCYLARAKLRIRADPCLSHAWKHTQNIRRATQVKSVIVLEANVGSSAFRVC